MRSDVVVQHDDGTPTGSRSTSFFIRGILSAKCSPKATLAWVAGLPARIAVAGEALSSIVGNRRKSVERRRKVVGKNRRCRKVYAQSFLEPLRLSIRN